jgi:hypothetical protein
MQQYRPIDNGKNEQERKRTENDTGQVQHDAGKDDISDELRDDLYGLIDSLPKHDSIDQVADIGDGNDDIQRENGNGFLRAFGEHVHQDGADEQRGDENPPKDNQPIQSQVLFVTQPGDNRIMHVSQ